MNQFRPFEHKSASDINWHYIKLTLKWLAAIVGVYIMWESVPFYVVSPGFTAIQMRMGNVVRSTAVTGLYFKIPLVDEITLINNKIRKKTIETIALSKDLQTVNVGIAINYCITDAAALYRTVGVEFPKIILLPYAQESIKAGIARHTAEELIQSRHEVKEMVLADLRARLEPLNIRLIDINFVHSDFSHDFIHAVEQKQIAEQQSRLAKNLTEKIKEEAQQARIQADAANYTVKLQAETDAYALKIKKEMATPELIQLRFIEKWDGKLSQVSSEGIPFINLGK